MTGIHLDGARWIPRLPGSVPALVATLEITRPLPTLDARGYRWGYFLVLAQGKPVGWITCPVTNGRCTPLEIRRAIAATLGPAVMSQLLEERLRTPLARGTLEPADLFRRTSCHDPLAPFISVAVCTKDRPHDLERCLKSLQALDYPTFEVMVVDNGSRSSVVREMVVSCFPAFRYIREDRHGLDWARNRALELASAQIIAFTDDDVVVDASWLSHIACIFEDEDVAAVAGLIAPLELRTDEQLHFEVIGGFGRGCRKAWHRIDPTGRAPDVYHLGAGRFGAGANMAFRTRVLHALGGFDPALDVGTTTEGGGDLDVFLRILHEGYTLVYEPAALVWHRHRDTPASLGAQVSTWGTAIGAVLTAAFARYPAFRPRIVRFGLSWSWLGYVAPLIRNSLGPGRVPRRLRLRPLQRLIAGPVRYIHARRTARALGAAVLAAGRSIKGVPEEIAMRAVDLARGLESLSELAGVRTCVVHVFVDDKSVGVVTIENRGRPVSAAELRTRIAQELFESVLRICLPTAVIARMTDIRDLLYSHIACEDNDLAADEFRPRLASIVVATRSRPVQLRRCLASLMRQTTKFPYEIVVVDNDPDRGLTAPVIQEFPQARYVAEPIQGLAHARNTGFRAAHGDILVATDDDVVAPPGWLQELVQPFRFAHVGVATGLVAPLNLGHRAQREFERIGGLGKGPNSFDVGLDWLASRIVQPPRAWDLGATANAAFRREMLQDPRVGLLPESLGPGTPAGGGEDAYLFYRAIRMGYGVYYEAHAMLYHEHRADDRSLRRQMFDYGRGHVAYLLTTLAEDADLRAFVRLVTVLPAWHLWRLLLPFRRRGYRRTLVLAEFAGYAAGPWGWLQARLRDSRYRRRGRIASCTPLGTAKPSTEPAAT